MKQGLQQEVVAEISQWFVLNMDLHKEVVAEISEWFVLNMGLHKEVVISGNKVPIARFGQRRRLLYNTR